jgi:hypothetical protein
VRTGFPTLVEILLFGLVSIASPLLWIARFGLEDWLVKRDRRKRLLRSLEGVVFEAPGASNEPQRRAAAHTRPRLAITRRSGLTAPRLTALSLLKQPLKFDE